MSVSSKPENVSMESLEPSTTLYNPLQPQKKNKLTVYGIKQNLKKNKMHVWVES